MREHGVRGAWVSTRSLLDLLRGVDLAGWDSRRALPLTQSYGGRLHATV